MKLSEHFSLEEMTATSVRGVDNTPIASVVLALKDTAERMEAVRTLLGHPVVVTSGYRSALVNKVVGGVSNSAHISGHAVDFICPEFGSPYDVARAVRDSGIKYDQLIREYGWVHLSFDPAMRGDVLTKNSASAPYEKGLVA